MRLAVWSGPRNLSTAMMYSFAQRSDFTVVDEPFYVPYLAETGIQHPMRDAVLASRTTDAAEVVDALLGPTERAHVYHKHMVQHMVPAMPMDWVTHCTHVFLIRHPARVAASFAAKYDNPTADDLGFTHQAAVFANLQSRNLQPLVIESSDIRDDPARMLRVLCQALDLEFEPAMLHWPRGGNPADGVWAAHWYGAVHRSTGFAGPEDPLPDLTGPLAEMVEAALPGYEALARMRLRA